MEGFSTRDHSLTVMEGVLLRTLRQRLYLLEAWRESPFYCERERAALAWAEAVTLLTNKEVPDDVYEQARSQFNEQELAILTLAVVAINSWNRFEHRLPYDSRQLSTRHVQNASDAKA